MKIEEGDMYLLDFHGNLELALVREGYLAYCSLCGEGIRGRALNPRVYIHLYHHYKINKAISNTSGGKLLYELMYPGFTEALNKVMEE